MRAQGTIEYLVSIGFVILIGLAVTGIMVSFLNSPDKTSLTVGKIQRLTSGISITDAAVDYTGTGLIKLTNNTGDYFTITKIKLGTGDNNYTKLTAEGQDTLFQLTDTNNCTCQTGQQKINCNLTIYYTTKTGIQKQETTTITTECINDANSTTATRPTTPSTPGDTTPPTITLTAPDNNTNDTDGNITFTYTTTEDNNITTCSLIIDNNAVTTDTDGTYTTFNYQLTTPGTYRWDVNCTDTNNNQGTSDTNRTIRYNKIPTITLNNPIDNNRTTTATTDFNFSILNLAVMTKDCNLGIDNNYDANSITINQTITTNTSYKLSYTFTTTGDHNWNIQCKNANNDTNKGKTTDRNINYTTTNGAWACGDTYTDTRDSKTYTTVLIGTQCWFSQNLNYGTRIDLGVPSNDSAIEKFCFNNLEANCDANGALYTWNEAVNLPTSCLSEVCTANLCDDWSCPDINNVQGACPQTWHVPSDAEWHTLEDGLKGAGATCDATRIRAYDCNNAGDKLKDSGLCQGRAECDSTGFNAYHVGISGWGYTFSDQLYTTTEGIFREANELNYDSTWARIVDTGVSTIKRWYCYCPSKDMGVPIRCIRDSNAY
jgi:uncharacterized protein (TIGR02145 family)